MKCVTCGKGVYRIPDPPLPTGAERCSRCVFRRTAKRHLGCAGRWKELRDLFAAQGGRCAYTGERLRLGIDATIDHREPKARGGSGSVANLQWVLAEINEFKGSLSHARFLDLCRRVARAQDNARANPDERGPA